MNTNDVWSIIVPTVFFGCALVGFIIKHWTENDIVVNKLIPTIVMLLGAVWYHYIYGTIDSVVVGAIVGFASTGAHQWITKLADLINALMQKEITGNINDEGDDV